jgi:hypothetical protein
MPHKIIHNGTEYHFEGIHEMEAFARNLGLFGDSDKTATRGRPVKSENGQPQEKILAAKNLKTTLVFLEELAIRDDGADADEVTKFMQLSSTKNIGVCTSKIRSVLERYQIDRKSAYRVIDTPRGKIWKPGARIADAINKLCVERDKKDKEVSHVKS